MTQRRAFINLDDLKAAGRRTDDYEAQYGVSIAWTISVTGLRLDAAHGAEKIVKYVDWDQLATAQFDILDKTEKAALAGLSS